ncbi:hypothetical protein EDC04DRAFT_2599149 [Pisolithus marmoratus]|nr:hypothetical protein EDC04DRAFT_2599149 [Pisolithus marmoratus]
MTIDLTTSQQDEICAPHSQPMDIWQGAGLISDISRVLSVACRVSVTSTIQKRTGKTGHETCDLQPPEGITRAPAQTKEYKLFGLLRKDAIHEQRCYSQPGIGTYFELVVVSPLFSWCTKILDEAIAWVISRFIGQTEFLRYLDTLEYKPRAICNYDEFEHHVSLLPLSVRLLLRLKPSPLVTSLGSSIGQSTSEVCKTTLSIDNGHKSAPNAPVVTLSLVGPEQTSYNSLKTIRGAQIFSRLKVPVIADSAAAPVERRAGDLLVPKTVWCSGFWNGCGELCPPDAPQFETRRSCTINGQTAYEYWCCYSS